MKIPAHILSDFERQMMQELGLKNVSRALDGLDPDEIAKVTISNSAYTGVGKQNKTLRVSAVTESGIYALIFKSRKPEAKRFRKWVTSEVLPQIRKYGSYQQDRSNLKPGYTELSSNIFRIVQSKDTGRTATQAVANDINRAVIGMTAKLTEEQEKILDI